MALDWAKCPAVESVAEKLSGAWGRKLAVVILSKNRWTDQAKNE
jgi:hypothetical protein